MKDEDKARIDMLNSLNRLNLAQDYITSLTESISKNKPNDKWEKIAKELNGICLDVRNSQIFFSRIFQELEIQAEINFLIKDKSAEQILKAIKENENLRKENNKLKSNIK